MIGDHASDDGYRFDDTVRTAGAVARAYEDRVAVLEGRIDRMRSALATLERWDMLALTADGKGAATADAPWARRLITDALADPQASTPST